VERLWTNSGKVFPSFPTHSLRCGRKVGVDAVDRKILAELQRDGRLTITELAEKVQLSVSPCHRRLRLLEHDGVIAGYRAVLNPEAVGLGFSSLVFVTMRESDSKTVAAFEAAITEVPNIVQGQRLFGDPDYLLRVVTADLPAFQELYDSTLAALPGVQRLTSTLIMKDLVGDRPLPT
jgi:DNA-binding Lrp family transcriptional regulator